MTVGNAIQTYTGEGTLTFVDGDHIRCDFECAQLPDARIVCHCLVQGLENEYFNRAVTAVAEWDEASQLLGQTDEGADLKAYHLRRGRSPTDPQLGADNEAYVLLSFLARELKVRNPTGPQEASFMAFGLTNLEFVGTQPYVDSRSLGTATRGRELCASVAGRQVTVRPLDDYKARLGMIKALRGIDVTSEAFVEIESPAEQAAVIDLISDTCNLLSLAKGTRVQWIYYDLYSNKDELVEAYHREAVTKSYSPLPLIAARPPRDMKCFLEQTFDRFRERTTAWDLRKVIDAYVDARLEQDFLEFRGLKAAILMDFLETHYLTRLGQETVLSEEVFLGRLEILRSEMLAVLERVFPDADEQQLNLMARHLRGLNYYPFRQAFRDMLGELGLKISSDELQRFMVNRNRLVHYGEFISENYWQEYRSMMAFVDRVLLAILAYDGYYYDWTQPGGWVGQDMEMRVELALEPGHDDGL